MQKGTKTTSVIMLTLCLLVAVFLCMIFVGCNGVLAAPQPAQTIALPKASAFVCIDINPSVEFVLDQYGRVMSVSGTNVDGQIILWEEDGIVGANMQFAIKKIATLAQNYGYISTNNNTINVSVCSDEDKLALFETISSAITDSIKDIDIKIENNLDFVLSNELEQLKKSMPLSADYASLTVEKYRLIKRAVEYDKSLTFETAAVLTTEQLLSIVQKVQADSATKLGKSYEIAVSNAQFSYELERQLILDEQYVQYFIDKTLNADGVRNIAHFAKKAVYAANYKTLRKIQVLLSHYLYEIENDYTTYSYDNVRTICDSLCDILELSVDDVFESIKDARGDITLEGINSYLNKIYRNLDEKEREMFVKAYDVIKSDVLDCADLNNQTANMLLTEISDAYNNETQSLPKIIKDFVEDSLFDVYTPNIDYADSNAVKEALQTLEVSICHAFENMALSNEDANAIEELQSGLSDYLSALKDKLNEQINQAKEETAQFLTNKKTSLISER